MSWFRNLFVSQAKAVSQPYSMLATGPSSEGNGEFITAQTLATFAGATFVISLISGVILRLLPSLNDAWVGAAVAFVIGLFLLWINLTDPRVRKGLRSRRDWGIAVAVGLANCFYLAAVALGTFKAIEATTAGV